MPALVPIRLVMALSSQVLKTFKDRGFTTTLGNLFLHPNHLCSCSPNGMERIIISLDLVAVFSYCSLAYRLTCLCCELTVGSCSAHATVTPRISLSKAENFALLLVKLHEVSFSQILNPGSIFQHINSLPHRGTLSNNQGHL